MAKTDADGRFRIKSLPVGQHRFQIWHERIGYVRNVRFGSSATDAKGRLTVKIRDGENTFGDVLLSPTMFGPAD